MVEKFFTEGWVAAALVAEKAASDDIYKRFKRPTDFTHVIALEVTDHPELKTHLEYREGRSVKWIATDLFPEDQVWGRFAANLADWRTAAEGKAKASNLVMAGKIKLVKGQMKDALETAQAFDRLVQSFGEVETDWAV